MNMLTRWIKDAQEINVAEKGVNYSEEAFTQLYEEALKLDADHKIELKFATGRGTIIGAAGVGLVALTIKGVNKLRKRNLEDKKEAKDWRELVEGVNEAKTYDLKINENGKIVKRLSRKDKDDLKNVIDEIKENEKLH